MNNDDLYEAAKKLMPYYFAILLGLFALAVVAAVAVMVRTIMG